MLRNTRAQSVIINPAQDEDIAAVRDIFIDLLRLPDANRLISGMISSLDVQYPGLGPRIIDLDPTTRDGLTRVIISGLMRSGRGLLLSLDGKLRSIGGWRDRVDHVAAETDEKLDGVLVRPDGCIAWSASADAPLGTALFRWFGRPR